MTAVLVSGRQWRSQLRDLFQHFRFLGLGDSENTMTSTTNHTTSDIDTSMFLNDPDPALVTEAKAAVLAALDAAPGSVIERACLARTLSKELTASAQPGAFSAFDMALSWLHGASHLSVVHVGTRTVIVGDPLVKPLDQPRVRAYLVA